MVRLELEDIPAAPPNDQCGDPKVITSVAFTEIVDTRNTSFDDWDPDPTCVLQAPRNNVWYSYTPASDGVVAITTEGSTYDTGVAVYVGTCHSDDDTMLSEVACAGDACFGDGQPSRLSFAAVAGTTYLIMVWDEAAAAGGGTLVFHLSQLDVCHG
jgi:hypothetical protein